MYSQADRRQALVDAEDLDALFEIVTLDEVAAAWHRYKDLQKPKSAESPDWWAVELLMSRELFRRTRTCRELIIRLVDTASGEQGLSSIVAGPLEDLVSDDEQDLAWIEAQCQRSAKFELHSLECGAGPPSRAAPSDD